MRNPQLAKRMRASLFAAAALVTTACGDRSQPAGLAPYGGDAPVATAFLPQLQKAVVGDLSGFTEVAPGVRLARRASRSERATTRDYLIAKFAELGLTAELAPYRDGGANVIAKLEATVVNPGPPIIIGAHLDSVAAGPGAADNATGVAIVLALAAELQTFESRQYPVWFMMFDEEELGLIGSDAFARQLVRDQVEITAVYNFDMLSYDGDGDGAIELWSPSPALESAWMSAGQALGVPVQPVPFEYSDHQAFLKQGFFAVGVGEEFVANDHTPHYHRSTDTYDRINFSYLTGVTNVAIYVLENELAVR